MRITPASLAPRPKSLGMTRTLGAMSLDAEALAILLVNAADIVWRLSKAEM
jgi:hypothetical protein